MRFLRQGQLVLLILIFGFVALAAPKVEAQLFDGKLPKIFNRDDKRDDGRPTPITRDSPDITFTRDFGIPTPYSIKIETIKAHLATFPISASTKTPGMMVDFLIRDFPTAGKLISLVSNPENRSSAIVTYLADPNSGATRDSFTFAARYPGGKYSATARCDIQITDAQAMIEISSSADFGKVLIGKKVEREIVITNRGNAPYNTKLNLFSPWEVVQPKDGNLYIGAGQQARVMLGFNPALPGAANYQLILNRRENGTCNFSGEAIIPFSITTEEWLLKLNPDNGCREADVLVTSHLDRPVEVYLKTSPRLKVRGGDTAVLIPNRDTRIPIYLEADDVMAFDGGLEVKVKEGYKAITGVISPTLPSKMLIQIPDQLGHEVINFGNVTAGRSTERGIILTNQGGELMPLDVSVSEPFRVLTKTDRQLVPLDNMPLTIGFYPHKSDRGAADQYLTLRTNHEEIKIRLIGNALRPPGSPRETPLIVSPAKTEPDSPNPSPTTAPGPEIGNAVASPTVPSPDRIKATPPPSVTPSLRPSAGVDLTMSPLGIPTFGIVARDRSPDLKSATDFQLLKSGSRFLEFGWTAPKDSDIDKFELEMRGQRTNPITGNLESVWAPYPNITYERVDRLVKARVKDLDPYSFYEFRAFTVDLNGRSSEPSVAFGAQTSRTMDWTYIYATLALIFVGFIIWGIVKIIRDRRGEVYQSEYVAQTNRR